MAQEQDQHQKRRDWLFRVLGVDVGAGPTPNTGDGRVAALLAKLEQAGPRGVELAAQAKAATAAGNAALVGSVMDVAEDVLAGRTGGDQPAPAPGMAGWRAARDKAIGALRTLDDAVRKGDDPERDSAVILLRAIRANLTESPADLKQVAALQAYLADDDIIDAAETVNGYGVTISLRAPLLAALAGLRAELAR